MRQLSRFRFALPIPYPRVDGGVQQLSHEVGEHNADDHNDRDRLHQRDVAPVDRDQQQTVELRR
jgi:hypothetical protein